MQTIREFTKKNIGILLITFIAFFLRLYKNDFGLWYDEAWSVYVASGNILKILWAEELQHMPLYFIILKFWMIVFGGSDFSLRLSSILTGTALVPISYIVGKNIYSKKAGLIASVLIMSNNFLVLYSQEIRMYNILVILSVLSCWFLWRIYSKNKGYLALTLTNIAIIYTLPIGIVFVLAQMITKHSFDKKINKLEKSKQIKHDIFTLLASIPAVVLLFHYYQINKTFILNHIPTFSSSHIFPIIRSFFGSTLENNIYSYQSGIYEFNFIFIISALIPIGLFLWLIVKSTKDNRFNRIIALSCLVVFLIVILLAHNEIILLSPRYAMIILPPLLVLASYSLSKFNNKTIIVFLIFIVGMNLFFFSQNTGRVRGDELDKAAIYLNKNPFNNNDVVLFPFGGKFLKRYYDGNVLDVDFLKMLRNPDSEIFYTKIQSEILKRDYAFAFREILSREGIPAFEEFTKKNIIKTIPKGRYFILILHNLDYKNLLTEQQTKNIILTNNAIPKNYLMQLMMSKVINRLEFMLLSNNFRMIEKQKIHSWHVFVFQKR